MKIHQINIKRKKANPSESIFDFGTKLWNNFERQIGNDVYIDSMKNYWDGYLLDANVVSGKIPILGSSKVVTFRLEIIDFADDQIGIFLYLPLLTIKTQAKLLLLKDSLSKFINDEQYAIATSWTIFNGKRPNFNRRTIEIRA